MGMSTWSRTIFQHQVICALDVVVSDGAWYALRRNCLCEYAVLALDLTELVDRFGRKLLDDVFHELQRLIGELSASFKRGLTRISPIDGFLISSEESDHSAAAAGEKLRLPSRSCMLCMGPPALENQKMSGAPVASGEMILIGAPVTQAAKMSGKPAAIAISASPPISRRLFGLATTL